MTNWVRGVIAKRTSMTAVAHWLPVSRLFVVVFSNQVVVPGTNLLRTDCCCGCYSILVGETTHFAGVQQRGLVQPPLFT